MLKRCRIWLRPVAAILLVIAAASAHAAEDTDRTVCQAAGAEAERQANLPPGLLQAIGAVESGRRDPATHRVTAWPWTINASGTGSFFDSLPEAVAATRARQARGIASIDVGCFQVNLRAHPGAFPNLETAFDPRANATYAAHFLVTLRDRTGTWEDAVAAYHSSTVSLGGPYRDLVLARWNAKDVRAVVAEVMRAVVWSPAGPGVHVWTPSSYGTAPSIITIRMPAPGQHEALPTVIKAGSN